MSNAFYDAANEIVDDAYNSGGKRQKFVDPATIFVVVELVQSLIQGLQACRQSRDNTLKMANKMSSRHERLLKRKVRRQMGVVDYYSENGAEIHKSVVKYAKKLNKDKVDELFEADEI